MPEARAKFERISWAELKAKLPPENRGSSGNGKNSKLVDGFPDVRLKCSRQKSRKTVAMEHWNFELRLLLINDKPGVSTLLNERLSYAGFVCQTATSGDAALKLLEHQSFDAIIWDLNMPEMSDLDLLARVRRTHPRTAFQMVTAAEGLRLGILALEQRANGNPVDCRR